MQPKIQLEHEDILGHQKRLTVMLWCMRMTDMIGEHLLLTQTKDYGPIRTVTMNSLRTKNEVDPEQTDILQDCTLLRMNPVMDYFG